MPTVAGTPIGPAGSLSNPTGTVGGTGIGGTVGKPPQWWVNAWAAAAMSNMPAAGQNVAAGTPFPQPLPTFSGNWIDPGGQGAFMRGHPTAFNRFQRRPIRGPGTVAQSGPVYLHSRGFSRGAGAFSPKLGVIPINPIGAGVVVPYKLPPMQGPGARYTFGAIWFNVQTIPTTINLNPTIPIQTMNALIATSSVAGTYLVD